MNPVAVGKSAVQWLEHHHASAFAPSVSIRPGIERVAEPIGGKRTGPGGTEDTLRNNIKVDAARDSKYGFAAPQALSCHMHGD